MPRGAMKPCRTNGCPGLTRGRFCDSHQLQENSRLAAQDERPGAGARGYDGRHRDWRARILRRDPLCRICRAAPATTADHIIPLRRGGRFTLENGQGVCAECHGRKTAQQDGGFGNQRKEAVNR
jgi:5-methylcytosine-specific restriction protein A